MTFFKAQKLLVLFDARLLLPRHRRGVRIFQGLEYHPAEE